MLVYGRAMEPNSSSSRMEKAKHRTLHAKYSWGDERDNDDKHLISTEEGGETKAAPRRRRPVLLAEKCPVKSWLETGEGTVQIYIYIYIYNIYYI